MATDYRDAEPDASARLDKTTVHDVLSNERRRALLTEVAADDRSHTIRELSERIAERESGVEPAPRDVRQSVYVSLQQTHVPRLVELGIVEFEDDREITLAERAADVTVYLEVVSGYELTWSEVYFGLGLLGLVTVLGSVVGVPVLAGLPVAGVAGAFLGLIAVAAAYHTWTVGSTVVGRVRANGRR